jgi:acetyltransferase-like isoleucine patch superfamily enzyme
MNPPVNDAQAAAMSPQQKRFGGNARLANYKDLIVGGESWPFFCCFELYNLCAAGLGSAAGIALRAALLSYFCRGFGRGTTIGKDVTIRQPRRISFGKAVIVDDGAVIDVRSHLTNPQAEVGIEIGNHVLIGRGSIVSTKGGHVTLGDACNISSFCRISTRSRIAIGPSVLIAAYAYIGCGNHTFDEGGPIIEQPMEVRGGVKIGANCWIGAKATVLDGVTIGENAIVGAHSLVKDDVPANAIVAGTPARIIRMR